MDIGRFSAFMIGSMTGILCAIVAFISPSAFSAMIFSAFQFAIGLFFTVCVSVGLFETLKGTPSNFNPFNMIKSWIVGLLSSMLVMYLTQNVMSFILRLYIACTVFFVKYYGIGA